MRFSEIEWPRALALACNPSCCNDLAASAGCMTRGNGSAAANAGGASLCGADACSMTVPDVCWVPRPLCTMLSDGRAETVALPASSCDEQVANSHASAMLHPTKIAAPSMRSARDECGCA